MVTKLLTVAPLIVWLISGVLCTPVSAAGLRIRTRALGLRALSAIVRGMHARAVVGTGCAGAHFSAAEARSHGGRDWLVSGVERLVKVACAAARTPVACLGAETEAPGTRLDSSLVPLRFASVRRRPRTWRLLTPSCVLPPGASPAQLSTIGVLISVFATVDASDAEESEAEAAPPTLSVDHRMRCSVLCLVLAASVATAREATDRDVAGTLRVLVTGASSGVGEALALLLRESLRGGSRSELL